MFKERDPRRGPVVLRDALRGFLRDSGLDARLRNARVYQAWNDALGPRLARRIMPVQFRFGELTLEAESSVHLHELQSFTGESYRQDANRRLGEERIRKLNFRLKR